MMQRDAEKDLVMCEKATPGPWCNDHDQVTRENGVPLFKAFRIRGDLQMRLDAGFITESREALPYWIKRAMAAERKLLSHDPDGRNYSNIEFVMMQDRALAAEGRVDKLIGALRSIIREYESEGTDIQVARRMRKAAYDTLKELDLV
jgi:hypothetical protein